MPIKDKVRVGILRGGAGENYKNSLRQGGDIIAHLLENSSDKYTPIDLLVDQEEVWHVRGVPIVPVDLMHKIDVVWNTSHPRFSNILTSFSVPNLGAPTFSTGALNSREMLEEHMKHAGVKMPRHIVFPLYQRDFDGPKDKYAQKKAMQVFEKFSSPWLVRSLVPDGDIGVHVAKTFPELVNAIQDCVDHDKSILVEELVGGQSASVHTVPGFRGEDMYATSADNISASLKEKLINLARDLHSHLDAKHYLRSNFVVHPHRGIFVTGFEFSPDLAPDSHFCQSCEAVGAKMQQVIEHIIEQALK